VTDRVRPPFRLEPLSNHHPIAEFASGHAAIDAYLHTSALPEQQMGLSSITVALDPKAHDAVIGFLTLSPLSIRIDPRVLAALGLAAVPYPAVGGYLLGRLGVDRHYQRRGIGAALVAVAVAQARHGRATTGGAFLGVDAKDDALLDWYERLGFVRLGSHTRRAILRL
jgi:ribosomal protein S18 acetylase RimI-like enzyme